MEVKTYFIQDNNGNVISNAAVYLYQKNTTTPVTIYDKAGNQIASPITSDANGMIQFAAPDGEYDLRAVSGIKDTTIRIAMFDATGLSNMAVMLSGAQVVDGKKTFSISPEVPTAPVSDISEKAASTRFVSEAVAAAGGVVLADIRTDPAGRYFGPTGIIIESEGGITGDAFVVRDDANSQWVMFFFESNSFVSVHYKTLSYADTIRGTWSAPTQITSLNYYHKAVLLVDLDGIPVKIDGNYHMYAASFTGTVGSKEIHHFTSATLTGPWAAGNKVLAKGDVGSLDDFFTDTPFAIYKDGQIYLWYMGAPASSQTTYGLATRMLRAVAENPDGPFTKNYADVLTPSATSADWDYGWMGGVQIVKRPNGRFMMVYNAGNTRPSISGDEPATSRVGYAYADDIDGPWIKDNANPYLSPTGVPNNALESTNIWRGHLVYDHKLGVWAMFYNTGPGGSELLTRADQDVYDYFYGSGAGFDVNVITTTALTTVTNSRVNLPAGTYRICAKLNVMGDGMSGSLPKLDVDIALRKNGVAVRTNREFIGNYAYENRDTDINQIITLEQAGYVYLSVQVVAGTPTSGTGVRRLRLNVEKIN